MSDEQQEEQKEEQQEGGLPGGEDVVAEFMYSDLELAQLMVKRADLARQVASVEAEIETAVVERKATQRIAGVIATYYKPSGDVDYEAWAREMVEAERLEKALPSFSTTTVRTRWLNVCLAFGLDTDEPPAKYVTPKPERVVIKTE